MLNSRLCRGTVVHRRYRPQRHALSYRVFSLLLDLDELQLIDRRCKLLAVNRPGVISWWERDHGLGNPEGLYRDIQDIISQSGCGAEARHITMLCFPRVFGYVFNPITVYFCRNAAGILQTMVYEVNNTFGDRRFYVVRAGEPVAGIHYHTTEKTLYVSPFNNVEGDYAFRVAASTAHLAVGVSLKVTHKPVLNAYHAAKLEPLSDHTLAAALGTMPLMTFKVIAGIHFEAMRLWLKGLRIKPRPRSKAADFTAHQKHQVPDHVRRHP